MGAFVRWMLSPCCSRSVERLSSFRASAVAAERSPAWRLALLSALFYATLPILHQRAAHIPTSIRTLGQFGVALLLFLLFLPKSNWDLNGGDWAALLFLAIGATLIAHTLWVRVTTAISPAAASVVYYGNVPFALFLAVVVLGEPLTWRTVTGVLLIIAGGVAGLLPQLQHRREAAPAPEE
jgi:drug/metabolite transporter (DMT)-like permease